jgi:hypothetical protein
VIKYGDKGTEWIIKLNMRKRELGYTEQFKKKITLSHVYNEVTSEPKITRYTTIVRKTLKVCL